VEDARKRIILQLANLVDKRAANPSEPWVFKVPDGSVCAKASQLAGSRYGPDICKQCLVDWGTHSGTCADYVPMDHHEMKFRDETANGGVPSLAWLRAFESDLRRWALVHEIASLSGLRDPKVVTTVNDHSTILEGRNAFYKTLEERGRADCKCCERIATLAPRSLDVGPVATLILLKRYTEVFQPEDGWVHVKRSILLKLTDENLKKVLCRRDDWGPYMRHWGLLERHPRHNYLYRITPKGINFVNGKGSERRTAFVYNNEARAWSDEVVSVFEGLEGKLEYHLLMNAYRTK